MKIGELLIMNGLITQDQLTQALNHQQIHSSQKLGEILIEQGRITEMQLAEALEFQLGIPVIKINEASIEKEIVQLLDEELALRLNVMPIERRAGKLRLAMADPLNKSAIQEVQTVAGMKVQPLIAIRSELEHIQKQYYGNKEQDQQFNEIIMYCLNEKSNEIYLEPQVSGITVKYRIENMIKIQRIIPAEKQKALINHIKRIAGINTSVCRLPQDGRLIRSIEDTNYDIKVSTLPTAHGERLFLRVTKRNQEITKLPELGLSEENLQILEPSIRHQKGLVLVSDEDVNSRTAMLYSLINHVMREEIQISTIEDPIEHTVEGITQVEVNEPLGLTFANGLRAILRQSPDIVMVGDMKDIDTSEIAVKTSISDSLLIAGIRGSTPVHTIKQLLEMGINSQLLALSLTSVIQQRFVRRVCTQCAQNTPMNAVETEIYGKHELLQPENQNSANTVLGNFRTFVSVHFNGKLTAIRGKGCRLCNHTGYRGQVGLYEVLAIDEPLRNLIAKKASFDEFEQYLKQKGHKALYHDGLLKARSGITTLEEVLKLKGDAKSAV